MIDKTEGWDFSPPPLEGSELRAEIERLRDEIERLREINEEYGNAAAALPVAHERLIAVRARNVELEAMVQAARADVERAAAFLDGLAVCLHRKWDRNEPDTMLELHRHGDACRAVANSLRGET